MRSMIPLTSLTRIIFCFILGWIQAIGPAEVISCALSNHFWFSQVHLYIGVSTPWTGKPKVRKNMDLSRFGFDKCAFYRLISTANRLSLDGSTAPTCKCKHIISTPFPPFANPAASTTNLFCRLSSSRLTIVIRWHTFGKIKMRTSLMRCRSSTLK